MAFLFVLPLAIVVAVVAYLLAFVRRPHLIVSPAEADSWSGLIRQAWIVPLAMVAATLTWAIGVTVGSAMGGFGPFAWTFPLAAAVVVWVVMLLVLSRFLPTESTARLDRASRLALAPIFVVVAWLLAAVPTLVRLVLCDGGSVVGLGVRCRIDGVGHTIWPLGDLGVVPFAVVVIAVLVAKRRASRRTGAPRAQATALAVDGIGAAASGAGLVLLARQLSVLLVHALDGAHGVPQSLLVSGLAAAAVLVGLLVWQLSRVLLPPKLVVEPREQSPAL